MFLEHGDALRKYFDTEAGATHGTTVCYVSDIVIHLLLRLIKMLYTEQDVCRQVTGRFLASRKEGETKERRRNNMVGRDKVRRRVGWRTYHLSSDDRTQETLLYTSNCVPSADKSLSLTPAWYPNSSIEHHAREVSSKPAHGWHFSIVFGPNQAS